MTALLRVLPFVVVLATASCGIPTPAEPPEQAADPSATQTPSRIEAPTAGSPTPSTSPGPPGDDIDPELSGLVDVAVADLTARTGRPASDVVVVSAEAVTWPDAGLGCPVPDMRYRQVPVDGTLVVLSIDEVLYRYHSGGTRPPFLCTAKG